MSGSSNPDSVNMTSDKSVTATFTLDQYTLTITTTGGGTTSPLPGVHTYTSGTNVPVTAIPSAGYVFDHWELDSVIVGSANPYTVTMNDNHALHAVFEVAPPVSPAVGGYAAPIEIAIGKESSYSLASQIGLAFALLLATVAAILLVKRKKDSKKIH